jgi:hypothetical protein
MLDEEEVEQFMRHVSAATSLTALVITARELFHDDAQICVHLTRLQQLRDLQLSYVPNDSRDALHLTTLTGRLVPAARYACGC